MLPFTIYEAGDNGLWVFLLVTVLLGASGAFVSGKALAQTWRPIHQIVIYMLLLTCAVRFVHYALFHEVMLSWQNFLVDFVILLIAAFLGYRVQRAAQMADQYPWLFDRTGPMGWRRKA
jgi:predicted membrane channel-forming protein YqfA (hemolysin III family)